MAEAARIDARRAGMLAAMGIEVYRLRSCSDPATGYVAETTLVDERVAANDAPRVVIVCAKGDRGDARLARLYAQLPRALGADPSAIDWCEADAQNSLSEPPHAHAYLAFGAAMARALGAHLSTAQQQASVIAVTADTAQLPGGAIGKRALWQALKPIARALRGQD